jgi:hypothetical protein
VAKNKQACIARTKNNRSPLKQQWVALRASLHNSEQDEKSCLMARLYNEARTYFIEKS